MAKLLKDNKELMKEYNYEKNKEFNLNSLTFSSGKKVWWKCKKGHEWQAIIANRNKGQGCPICSGKKVVAGVNDLFTVIPELKKEWDFDKNIINPREISVGSNKDAFWVCKLKHKYKMRISHRTSGHGCPYCSGNRILTGYNDLKTWCKNNNPGILEKWDYRRNGMFPIDESKNSKRIVWWKCAVCGNEYKNKIRNEISNIFCPKCNKRNKTSFPEQAIYYYIKKVFPDAINGYKDVDKGITELDIYIPSKKLGIEYDGEAWHNNESTRNKELLKYEACKKNDIKLIRFKEKINDTDRYLCDELIQSSYNKDISIFNEEIKNFMKQYSNIKVDVDIDRNNIYEQYLTIMREKSLKSLFPKIAEEWDYDKNYPLKPDMVPAFINESFYFKCKKGHSYKIIVSKRTSRGDGCPYCSGHQVLIGYNDLLTTHKSIAEEWDYKKNEPLRPENISKGYDKKVWWICPKCHTSYRCSPNTRISGNVGCSKCNGGVSKKINQYDLDGKLLKTYDSCSQAAKDINGNTAFLSRACNNHNIAYNYQWRYASETKKGNITSYVPKIFNNKKVVQYTLDGKYIRSYDSITIAKKETGASKIGEVCAGRRKTSGGYVWKYDE